MRLCQEFHMPVGQVVQAESLHQYASTVAATPESQLQVEFAQRTGIWCPKPARMWLEDLMEHHHFTARELAVCWKAGPIGWNANQNVPRISTSLAGSVFAYTVVGLMTVFLLSVGYLLLAGDSNPSLGARVAIHIFGVIYLGLCWMASRFILWPRSIAIRVIRSQKTLGGSNATHLS